LCGDFGLRVFGLISELFKVWLLFLKMDDLYFITGNEGKFLEARLALPDVKQIDIDLPEIQEIDARKIIEEKLQEAIKKMPGKRFFCEDTSLYIEGLNGLPGPLFKWFYKTIGVQGVYDMVKDNENKNAKVETIVGYSDGDKILFFEGSTEGVIVSPKGGKGMGWAPIVKPNGSDKTFGEMELEEKKDYSMRRKALAKLKDYLDGEND
jgi:non-canonical purine NTP pyrophosphatase (RdgB/HAM1 family)